MKRKRLLLVDVSRSDFVGLAQRVGMRVFRASFDRIVACRVAGDVYAALEQHAGGELEHVQVWGHGLAGAPYVGHRVLDRNHASWTHAKGASIWFRSCLVAQGIEGHRFMERMAEVHGVDVVAHVSRIGLWGMHSNLVGLRAGEQPWWSVEYAPHDSSPWSPRTVPATCMSLPSWAFSRGGLP